MQPASLAASPLMAGRLVVIGGDAGGMTAATQARRRDPSLEIVALEQGNWASYSACGIPYLVGGQVDGGVEALVARTPQRFRDERIDLRLRHEVTGIDLEAGKVEVRNHEYQRTFTMGFDRLLVGTGARPLRPDLPGIDLPFVHGVQTLDDADHLLAHARDLDCRRVVVVGGGYIGLEMAEAFVSRGAEVALVEADDEVMGTLDTDMSKLVSEAVRRHGVDLRTATPVEGFEPGQVLTAAGPLDADLVVLGLGVTPNSELAAEAGVRTGAQGAIAVDRRQRTSHEAVWAAGDCCESFHRVSRRWVHIALGTVANKQGRVAGINLGGGYATFPGVVGTAVTKVCATEVARTGLSERECHEAGIGFVTATIDSTTRAGYYPGAKPITVKVLAERGSGRLLGAQLVGEEGAGKRIDAIAVALQAELTAQDLVDADLAYAPPFGPLWDPVAVAARSVLKEI
jgi:NADPH-dependent 2,4-dienoyl-CoA reductase/sulfur reductase-like enzyme